MNRKYLKLSVWGFFFLAILALLLSFTVNGNESLKYAVIATILWMASKGINIYLKRTMPEDEEE